MPLTQVQGGMLQGSTNTTTTIQSNGTTAITIDSSQNVGIGTSSPAGKLDVRGAGYFIGNGSIVTTFWGTSANINDGSGYCQWNTSETAFKLGAYTNNPCIFVTNNSERIRITSGGDIYCGQSSYTFGVNPTTGTDIVAGGLIINATRRTTGASGNTLWDSAGVFYRSTSSLKYKRDVETMQYGLNEVMSLRPVTFASKSEVDGDNRFGGFIAEEVDALGLKEFVSYDQENAPDGLQYANMVALLTKAIQELNAKVEAQAAEIAALKAAP